MHLETFFTLDEALWAAEAVGAVTDLRIVMSFSFDQGTKTMMGLSPADVTAATENVGVGALGTNCGRSLRAPVGTRRRTGAIKVPDGSAQLLDADEGAGGIAEGAVAYAVGLLGGALGRRRRRWPAAWRRCRRGWWWPG